MMNYGSPERAGVKATGQFPPGTFLFSCGVHDDEAAALFSLGLVEED
ncbi:hypothetical protein TPY_2136 [Sulfobacillus acidophilus TPY]|nr:hypothetical protein TPY_2136 [Sulfobacillus acidophilus TPY]